MTAKADYARICERGGVVDLSDRARFRMTGEDRVRYLNGQISNRVNDLTPGTTRRACVMTAKGKLSADIFYAAAPEFLRLDAAGELRETLAARLERYIVADDVTLIDVGEDERLFHVFGPAAKDIQIPGIEVSRSDRLGTDGLDLYVPVADGVEAWRLLCERFPVVDRDLQEMLRIERGIPAWGAELDENTIPVEAGLERTSIDYHKGCYIGQEVISRLKSVGHVNRELRGLVGPEDGSLSAGMELIEEPSKVAGRITSTAYSFALARPVALGYVKRGVTAGTLLARAGSDPSATLEVQVRPLPLI